MPQKTHIWCCPCSLSLPCPWSSLSSLMVPGTSTKRGQPACQSAQGRTRNTGTCPLFTAALHYAGHMKTEDYTAKAIPVKKDHQQHPHGSHKAKEKKHLFQTLLTHQSTALEWCSACLWHRHSVVYITSIQNCWFLVYCSQYLNTL